MPEFTVPPLPYDYSALEPTIDTLTMQIHHDKHHAAYVANLNAAIKDYPQLQEKSIEDLISDLNAIPDGLLGLFNKETLVRRKRLGYGQRMGLNSCHGDLQGLL